MIWRLFFLVVYVIFILMRSPYCSTPRHDENTPEYLENLNSAIEYEGKITMIVRSIISLAMLLSIIIYEINPSWLGIFALPIPIWLRLIGLGLAIIALPLLFWTHHYLGQQYSPDLELKEEHKLITSGPYKIVRHPMYTILIVYMLGVTVLAANAMILVPHLAAIILLLLRLSKEEAMLLQKFGDEYSEYMVKTGRLLPKPRKISVSY